MSLENIPIINMLSTKMKYDLERQSVISENIANADTPEYNRKDLEKPDFSNMLKSSSMALTTTDPKHIKGLNSSTSFKPVDTGNLVQLDMEAMELTKNNTDFRQATTTYSKIVDIMNLAIGNNS